jgi:hypothetical protein
VAPLDVIEFERQLQPDAGKELYADRDGDEAAVTETPAAAA